jgi:hypothetical protein
MRRLRRLGKTSAPFILLSGMFGCTATVVDAADGGPATTTQALVSMERAEREGKPAQTSISAKFLRVPVAADSDAVERVVGSELDLPAVGECMMVSASEDALADASAIGPIELFDVGDVTIQTAAGPIPLAARAFPDVGDRVSGVFYTSPDAARDLPAPGKYVLEGSGSQPVDRFAIESEAPPTPAEVTIGGRPLADGVELAEGAAIDVAWRASAAHGEGSNDDVAYVEIVAENGVAVRCAFDDRGRGRVPASLLEAAGFGRLPLAATLGVHRVRQGTFQVPGLDLGEVRFDMSVVAGVTLLGSATGAPSRGSLREPLDHAQ